MSNFHVGQKVVCIDDTWPASSHMKAGEVYTVEGMYEEFLILEGICVGSTSRGFFRRRFKPLQKRATSMDIIRSIVLDPAKPIPADPREPVITPVPEYDGYEVRI